MTITTKIKIAATVLLLLVFSGGWLYLKALKSDNRRLALEVETVQAQAEALAREAAGLQRALAANFQALEAREKKMAELAGQTETLRLELEELYANNEPCRAWADADVPGPVLDRLRK